MTAYNRFAGEPAIRITDNGASMEFKAGQPIMDQGLNNAVIISLFTKPGWWGNALIDDPVRKIGSSFQQIRTIIDTQTINDVEESASDALKWMKDSGLAEKIDITVVNPYGDQIHVYINISPPGQDQQKFIFTKNGLSWLGQAQFPVNERFSDGV